MPWALELSHGLATWMMVLGERALWLLLQPQLQQQLNANLQARTGSLVRVYDRCPKLMCRYVPQSAMN